MVFLFIWCRGIYYFFCCSSDVCIGYLMICEMLLRILGSLVRMISIVCIYNPDNIVGNIHIYCV
jgi:hypothetical protein